MDETLLVILLLSGFCAPCTSFTNMYYFIKEKMTWAEANAYCISQYTAMAQIQNMKNVTTMMNVQSGGFTDKAWIGLLATFEWTWVNGDQATFFKWGNVQPDEVDTTEYCVTIDRNGTWGFANCSLEKAFLCNDGGGKLSAVETNMTWNDAKTRCEETGDALAIIPNDSINTEAMNFMLQTDMWIGLSRHKLWFWSELGFNYNFTNWQQGQPNNTNEEHSCAAVVLSDGTWTDEPCNAVYPFFCYGLYQARQTVVRMEIKSSANMEDPACSADLQEQLRAALANRGVTDFKLTWNKLPVKQTPESSDKKDNC